MRSKIVATGRYLPPRIETSAELAPRLGIDAAWIDAYAGVEERRVSDLGMAEMGARAAEAALGDGPPPDLILNASGVPQQVIPDSSVYIQEALGMAGTPSYSIHATCLSFLVALHSATGLIAGGTYRRILIVSSELGTFGRNFEEPESAVLFGDGAAAAIVEPTPDGEASELLTFEMGTWPAGAHLTEVRGGGTRLHPNDPKTTPADNLFSMDGPGVYKMARRRVPVILKKVLRATGLTQDDINLVVPHQASGPGVEAVAHYGFPEERIVNIVRTQGNCVAASMPLALAAAHEEGRIARGDHLLLAGTGAGLSVAAAIIRW
ncbi:MAG: 3-oxoacyl-[acyl-carrier-protein] synthase III C-terminal domain-containing protein [Myxococcota bacterium]|jgi:3-oxoacyl-[acyl-carrier-protein] synthase-3|nr:3-oxoacyl-[acyl-carrier-protein] synthase III C-terminal domain-containing protein [Myxococcota bacterium]